MIGPTGGTSPQGESACHCCRNQDHGPGSNVLGHARFPRMAQDIPIERTWSRTVNPVFTGTMGKGRRSAAGSGDTIWNSAAEFGSAKSGDTRPNSSDRRSRHRYRQRRTGAPGTAPNACPSQTLETIEAVDSGLVFMSCRFDRTRRHSSALRARLGPRIASRRDRVMTLSSRTIRGFRNARIDVASTKRRGAGKLPVSLIGVSFCSVAI